MAQHASQQPIDLDAETPDQRQARLAWERERIAEAEAEIAAGRYIEGEEAIRWLESEIAEAERAAADAEWNGPSR